MILNTFSPKNWQKIGKKLAKNWQKIGRLTQNTAVYAENSNHSIVFYKEYRQFGGSF
jgi:hypothetical protein